MSVFDNNITNEIPVLSKGQRFMKAAIYSVVNRYMSAIITRGIEKQSDIQEMKSLRQDIIYNWIGGSLREFNIDGTETLIRHSSIKGYKYEVIVNVRFIGETDSENYIEFIHVPIIKDSERKMYECIQ